MKSLVYAIQCAAVVELIGLILLIAPKNTVFATIVVTSLHKVLSDLKDLKSKGWLDGAVE